MTRKTLVIIIAFIYMALGLMSFCTSWVPSSSRLFVFNWLPLVGGALAAYAGFAMFRLSEIGRKLVVILLSIRVIMNMLLIIRVPIVLTSLVCLLDDLTYYPFSNRLLSNFL